MSLLQKSRTLLPSARWRASAAAAAGSFAGARPPKSVVYVCAGSMILGRGAPPGPYDSVVPDFVLSSPTPSATLVMGVAAPSLWSTASTWSSEALPGLPADESMRLPVRIVPAESCPLAFERWSMPSMTMICDFQLRP